MRHVLSLLVVASFGLLGCEGESDPVQNGGPFSDMSPPECASPSELCLAQPQSGFQVQSVGTTIEPGVDTEFCEVVQLPGDPGQQYYVSAFEVQMTAGSHHLIVAAIEPGTDTDAAANVGDRINCTGPDAFGGEILPVTGSQQPYNLNTFPEGVGRLYTGGQKLVFDYHYYNTTPEPLAAKAAVNFHLTAAEDVKKIAQSFGFVNIGISIPPGASRSFTRECTMRQDVMVYELTRHTHRWGTDFSASFAGGPRDGEQIFTSPDYETVNFPLAEPALVKAGEGFSFTCSYTNTEDYTLQFGLKATDEMCILFGSWYVVNDSDATPDQSCLLFPED
jgi:hypothetical protein